MVSYRDCLNSFRTPIFKRYDGVKDVICDEKCYKYLDSIYEVAPDPEHDTVVEDDITYISWNISRVDSNAYINESIRNWENSRNRYNLEFGWMGVDEFIAYQIEMFDAKIRQDRINERVQMMETYKTLGKMKKVNPERKCDDYGWLSFWRGVDFDNVEYLAERMVDDDVFNSMFITYDYCGSFDQQEGRHRVLAAKMLGATSIPVWKAYAR